MDNASKRHLVTSQPCAEKIKGIKCTVREWGAEIKRSDDPAKEEGHLRTYGGTEYAKEEHVWGGNGGGGLGRTYSGNSGCAWQ